MKPRKSLLSVVLPAAVAAGLLAVPSFARADEQGAEEHMVTVEPPPPAPAAPAAPPAPVLVAPAPRVAPHDYDTRPARRRSAGAPFRYRDEEESERKWYGWQTLLADSVSLATAPVYVGIPGFFLASPIIHLGHRNYGAAGASFGIRAAGAGVAVLGSIWAVGDSRGDFAGYAAIPFVIAGGTIGLTAVVLDAAVFAFKDGESAESRAARAAAAAKSAHLGKLSLTPSFGPMPGGGVALGLSGTL